MLFKGQGLLWVATFKQLFRLLRGEIPAVVGTPLASNWNNLLANMIPADTHTLVYGKATFGSCPPEICPYPIQPYTACLLSSGSTIASTHFLSRDFNSGELGVGVTILP